MRAVVVAVPARLIEALQAAGVEVVEVVDRAGLPELAARVAVAVVGPSADAPVDLAQVLGRADPDLPVLLWPLEQRTDEVAATLRTAPYVGRHARCLAGDEPIEAIVRVAVEEAQARLRRRSHADVARTVTSVLVPPALADTSLASQYLGQLLEHATIGVVTVDVEGAIRGWNPKATDITGRRGTDAVGTPLVTLFPPGEHHRIDRLLAESLRSTEARTAVVGRPGPLGDEQVLELTVASVGEDVSTLGHLVLLHDVTERVVAEREAAERGRQAALVAAVGRALTSGLPLGERLQRCSLAVVDHLGAASARVWTYDAASEVLVLGASAGMDARLDGPHSRIRLGELDIGRIAASRTPQVTNSVIGDPALIDEGWARGQGLVGFAGYPLLTGGELLGVLALLSRDALSPLTCASLEAVTDSIAVAVKQARDAEEVERLLKVERAAHARTELLADASRLLSGNLDVGGALDQLARLVVPGVADWCVIDLVDGSGGVTRVAVAERGRDGALSHRYEPRLPPLEPDDPSPLAAVLRGEGLVRLTTFPDPARAGSALHRQQLQLFEELGTSDAIIVELRARGRILGALTLARSRQAAYTPDDERFVAVLAQRAALAIDNAQLFAQERDIAETMQRSLLTEVPELDDLTLVARYHPAARGAQIGGDWYDAFTLPDDAFALVIGDVAGHDIAAAVRMGFIRNVLRAIAWDRQDPPSVIMARVDDAMAGYHPEVTATAILARVEASPAGPLALRWTNAGHPPPLLLQPDGTTELLTAGGGILLGAGVTAARVDAVSELSRRSRVLLYTDGLIENRRESLDVGLERLRRSATKLVRESAGDFCDALLAELAPDPTDDIALLLLEVPD